MRYLSSLQTKLSDHSYNGQQMTSCISVRLVYYVAISALLYWLVDADNVTFYKGEAETQNKPCLSPWLYFNPDTNECECYEHITCKENNCTIPIGHCMTYDESAQTLSYASCPFLLNDELMMTLPWNVSELNEYMCASHNREGRVCSECIEGFGPSLTSLGYECQNCSGNWQGLSLFFLLEFGPITVFYVIVLVFQISFTSAPVTGFVMYSQIIMFELILRDGPQMRYMMAEGSSFSTFIQVIATFFGIWNLDFFWYIIPPFCVSSKFKLIDLLFIHQICAFYPFFLILVTWICIELHGHNFRPLVWLWSPFHKCTVNLRRSLDAKNDIVDVFSSIFLLSCSKLVYQAITILSCHKISITNTSSDNIVSVITVAEDLSISCYSAKHLAYSVVILIFDGIFVLFPVLVLILYPTKLCRRCLSTCKLGGRFQTTLFTFVETFHSCYRDGLDGRRDMRSFSGIHFLLRFYCFVGWRFFLIFKITNRGSFFKVIGLVAVSILVAYVKPYKKTYMNIIDILLLSYTALFYFINAEGKIFTSKFGVINLVYLLLPMLTFLVVIGVWFAMFLYQKVSHKFTNRSISRRSECADNATSDAQESLLRHKGVQYSSYGTSYP